MMLRFLFLLAPGFVHAAAATEQSPWVGLVKIALSLGVIIVAIVLVLGFMRRLMVGGGLSGQQALLRLRGGIMLGQRERVVVVEIEDTWLVVGVTATQMTLLHTMPKGELSEPMDSNLIKQQWLDIWRKRLAGAKHE